MKVEKAVNAYEDFSGRASDSVRAISFGGLAFVWVLAAGSVSGLTRGLLLVCLLLGVTVVLDLSQYVLGTVLWGRAIHGFEAQKLKSHDEVHVEQGFTKWLEVLWWGKLLFLVTSYGAVLTVVARRLGFC